jgi:poly(glycerol-phosphate) alpha-glucosyltransferase
MGRAAKVLRYLGRLHRKKGLAALLRAWASAPRGDGETGEDWRLVIAGWDQGGHELELRQLAAQLGIADSVHFIGPQFGLAKESTLQSAHAFILPSLSEGLPMVVLEAWARNLPVLMTPACNLEEGFAAGAALPVDPEDGSICRGLDELFSMSAEQRRAIGAAGRQLISRRYSKDRVAAEMHAVYSWLLGRTSQPSCVQVM